MPDPYGPCPCGSGKKLRFCHKNDLNSAIALGKMKLARDSRELDNLPKSAHPEGCGCKEHA